jgi:hypothetical protein
MPAKPRKKWKVTYRGTDATDTFTSEKKTYEWLNLLARSHATLPDPNVAVWVDEGRGWKRFDEQNLAEWFVSQFDGK